MNLTKKYNRENLQEEYDKIVKCYNMSSFEQMKDLCYDFIEKLARADKIFKYKSNEKIDRITSRYKLLEFITNVHMQDSKETASIGRKKY